MLTVQDLIDDLASGCKPKSSWRIGVEIEQFACDKTTGNPLPYEGLPGIHALLEDFAASCGWAPIMESGHLIALERDTAILSLEPGGQVEYSGPPLPTLAAVQDHMSAFYRALHTIADRLGIGFLPAGFHPRWRREDMHWMPKQRYAIMRAYMPKVGTLGLDMMLRTCGMQVNLDYASEADMVRKFRVATGLQPVMTALTANSPCAEGRYTGYASYRSHIWTDTDNARCGVLPFLFDPDMGFARYVEYALDVPMYFIRRGGHYIDVAGQSFRAFMGGRLPGHEGEFPVMADWRDHLTTLFPEVRLKHYLELRGPDSNPPDVVMAMAAFWTGLLYDESVLDDAHAIVMNRPVEEHLRLRDDAASCGLEAVLGNGRTMRDFAADILALAERGLPRASHFLSPLYARLSEPPDAKRACEGL